MARLFAALPRPPASPSRLAGATPSAVARLPASGAQRPRIVLASLFFGGAGVARSFGRGAARRWSGGRRAAASSSLGGERKVLELPAGHRKVLLHSCCAPCSGEVMEAILASGIEYSIFFYNPNIHPRREYEIRKAENIRFADLHGIEFIDADYDPDNWFERIRGLEDEPEKGKRCTACFDFRFERTALYASEHGFDTITSCLGISRWKDMQQISGSGLKAAARYPGMLYWTYNWRKGGGADRMLQISKQEGFYQQEYCGCVYSLRDTNKARLERGREKIKIGVQYYSPDSQGDVSSKQQED